MSYFENGCTDPSWESTEIPAPYECPNVQGVRAASEWQNSGRYVQVCSASVADLALYTFYGGGDHSAVREVTGGGNVIKYLSKYGSDGPMVAHNIDGSYYHYDLQVNGMTHWSFVGQIMGNPNIVGTSSVNFYVQNKSDVFYNWSIVDGGQNIYISSGATTNSVNLTPIHSGTATLQLAISSDCGSVRTQQIALNIQTNICLEGSYDNDGINDQNLNTSNSVATGGVSATVTCPNATSFSWQKTSGDIYDVMTSGANVSFTMLSGGSISFNITAKNGSTTLATRDVSFYNFGSYSVSENPVSSPSFTIDLNKDLLFKVVLTRINGNQSKAIENFNGEDFIETSNLLNGTYSLKIFYEDKLLNQQQLIINRL